ncbi:MAG TPA: LOG family protein, partial [Acidimicrobiales bacterium]|nr:LOG family protein [Acidimicrobiales bacterium]
MVTDVPGDELVPPLAADTAGAEDTTGEILDPDRLRLVDALVESTGITDRRDLYRAIFATVVQMAADQTEPIDLKLAAAALAEMVEAFRVFRPYRHAHKVTFFGSARTLPDDPLYLQTRRLAERMAGQGWMVVTGAGPGIMAAGMEGAGREKSLGVNIRLPHEQGANPFIAQDPKLVEMRYFFTRKLMLIKESDGYAVLPGGFGTLDEAFELLTLLQTGKAQPAPLVLLDIPGGTYWRGWQDFLD